MADSVHEDNGLYADVLRLHPKFRKVLVWVCALLFFSAWALFILLMNIIPEPAYTMQWFIFLSVAVLFVGDLLYFRVLFTLLLEKKVVHGSQESADAEQTTGG